MLICIFFDETELLRLANLCLLLDEVTVTALAEIILIPSAICVVPIAFFCYHGLSGSVVKEAIQRRYDHECE